MAEQSNKEDMATQGPQQKDDIQGGVKSWVLENPTAVFTGLYAYVTLIGMIYSGILYAEFGVNIFDHSEITDFLLAAFKNPVAFLSAGLLALMGIAMAAFQAYRWNNILENIRRDVQQSIAHQQDITEAEAIKKEEEAIEADVARIKRRWVLLITIGVSLGVVFSSLIVPYYSANRKANFIEHSEHPAVDVHYRSFSGSAGQMTEPELRFIGATGKAAFFYDVDDKRTIVIPQVQVVSIEVPE